MESLALFHKSLVAEKGDRYFNKLFNTAQLGEAAAAQQAPNTTMTRNSIADIQAKAGLSMGQAFQNQYNAYGAAGAGAGEALGAGLNNWVQYSLYNPILQRLGGGGGAGTPYRDASADFSKSVFT